MLSPSLSEEGIYASTQAQSPFWVSEPTYSIYYEIYANNGDLFHSRDKD